MIARMQEKNLHGKFLLWKKVVIKGLERKLAAWATVDDYDSVLDMYCNSEAMLSYFGSKYQIRACGLCHSHEKAQLVRDRMNNAEIIYGAIDNIPWRDNTFDVAICGKLLDRLSSIDSILKDTLRVMKPGGQFVAACSWAPGGINILSERLRGNSEILTDARRLLVLMENTGYMESSWRPAGINSGIIIGWKAAV